MDLVMKLINNLLSTIRFTVAYIRPLKQYSYV